MYFDVDVVLSQAKSRGQCLSASALSGYPATDFRHIIFAAFLVSSVAFATVYDTMRLVSGKSFQLLCHYRPLVQLSEYDPAVKHCRRD